MKSNATIVSKLFSRHSVSNFGYLFLVVVVSFFTFGLTESSSAQVLTASRTSAGFGQTSTLGTSGTLSLEMSNTGNSNLTFLSFTLGGANPGDFQLVGALPGTPTSLAPNIGNITIGFQCAPTTVGFRSATFTVVSNSNNGTFTMPLICVGVNRQVVANTTRLSFPQTRVGEASTSQTLVIENQGTTNRLLTSITNPLDGFEYLNPLPNLPFVLTPNTPLLIPIIFTPRASLDFNRLTTLVTDDPAGNISVVLEGEGRIASGEVDVTALDFGSVLIPGPAETMTITLRNNGTAPFRLNNLTVDDPTHFSVVGAPALPLTLLPAPMGPNNNGEIIELTIASDPITVGQLQTNLNLITDIPLSPNFVIPLSAIGVAPELGLSSTAVDFGFKDIQDIEPGMGSVTLFNTGDFELTVSSIELQDINGNPFVGDLFAVVDDSPRTIPVGGSSLVEVQYAPTLEGIADEAVLRILSNGFAQNDVQVILIGTGSDRRIDVTPLSLAFPAQFRFPIEPPSNIFTITNTGQATLNLSMVSTQGDFADSFVVVDPPAFVGPNESVDVEVLFRPTVFEPANLTSELLIVNDDDNNPMVRINLSGETMRPELDVTPVDIDFGRPGVQATVTLRDGASRVTIRNQNPTVTFTIREILFATEDGESLDDVFEPVDFEFGQELRPFQEIEFDVQVIATEPGFFDGFLQIFVDADELPTFEVGIHADVEDIRVRGGSCSAQNGNGAGFFLLLGLLFLFSRQKKRSSLLLFISAFVLLPHALEAQNTRDIDANPFRNRPGIRKTFIGLQSPSQGDGASYQFAVVAGYSLNALTINSTVDDSQFSPLHHRASGLLLASYAFSFVEFGLSLPLYLQNGEAPTFGSVERPDTFAVGDLALQAKFTAWERDWISVGVEFGSRFPGISQDTFAGHKFASFEMLALGELKKDDFTFGSNLGLRFRREDALGDAVFGNELVYAFGAAYEFDKHWSVLSEMQGLIGFEGDDKLTTSPMDLSVGAVYRSINGWRVRLGGGRGFVPGVGAADFRGTLEWSVSVGDHTRDDARWVEPVEKAF